ncbi:MAG: CcmD family protein [Bacteroidota bacterium]|nr:CcmD family protein [Bacteroidota bacterium]MDQ6888679.1 CcmD family protein [Bacteroidota bacterium]
MVNDFWKRISFTAILFLFRVSLFAQPTKDSTGNSVDTVMRSHDKIYVVMAVCITILVVLFLYLIRIDRKVSRKERTV